MVLNYDRNPNITTDDKIQSLMESVQLALNEFMGELNSISNSLSRMDSAIDSLESAQEPVSYTDFTLPSTAAMGMWIQKTGNVVSITIENPTKLANQTNNLFYLPIGWRPVHSATFMLNAPSSTGVDSRTLRINIRADNGLVSIYNYSGAAISGNTNISQTCTYICSPT